MNLGFNNESYQLQMLKKLENFIRFKATKTKKTPYFCTLQNL